MKWFEDHRTKLLLKYKKKKKKKYNDIVKQKLSLFLIVSINILPYFQMWFAGSGSKYNEALLLK